MYSGYAALSKSDKGTWIGELPSTALVPLYGAPEETVL